MKESSGIVIYLSALTASLVPFFMEDKMDLTLILGLLVLGLVVLGATLSFNRSLIKRKNNLGK